MIKDIKEIIAATTHRNFGDPERDWLISEVLRLQKIVEVRVTGGAQHGPTGPQTDAETKVPVPAPLPTPTQSPKEYRYAWTGLFRPTKKGESFLVAYERRMSLIPIPVEAHQDGPEDEPVFILRREEVKP